MKYPYKCEIETCLPEMVDLEDKAGIDPDTFPSKCMFDLADVRCFEETRNREYPLRVYTYSGDILNLYMVSFNEFEQEMKTVK